MPRCKVPGCREEAYTTGVEVDEGIWEAVEFECCEAHSQPDPMTNGIIDDIAIELAAGGYRDASDLSRNEANIAFAFLLLDGLPIAVINRQLNTRIRKRSPQFAEIRRIADAIQNHQEARVG